MSDFFRQKFELKSNIELEEIVQNNIKYVLEARTAAISILRQRNYNNTYLNTLENNLQTERMRTQLKLDNLQKENEIIIKTLQTIPVNSFKKYKLNNWKELWIKRLNENKYEIKIDHSKSFFSPSVICSINKKRQIKYYPFFNINSTISIIIISLLILGYFYFQYKSIPNEVLLVLLTIISCGLIMQILLLPIIYPLILNTFKEEIKNENFS